MTDVPMDTKTNDIDNGNSIDEQPPPLAVEEANNTSHEGADEIEGSRSANSSDTEATSDGAGDDINVEDGGHGEGDDAPTTDVATSPDDLLLQAMSHKEDGNAHFKSGDYTAATRSYRRGTNALKNLNTNNTGDDQVKQLLITLQTNLSMVCYKQQKHKMSRDVATKAIEIESTNVKALYRRAVAHRAMGNVDSAKDDLRTAFKTDPNNVAVKKELISIKKVLEDRKAKEKARLSKAFSKGGSSLLYSDREEEEKRKEKEKLEKERLEKEAVEIRKKKWEDECVRRMSSDPPEEAISFDEWDKQRRKREEDEEKQRKKAKKDKEDKKREERRKAQKAAANNNSNNKNDDSDDEELTEEELKMLRGYKKTSDGRTTSYFNREQTEHEKELIGCIAPKRLDESAVVSPSPTAVSSTASAWNASGTTWEEKDTTDWCKKTLEECLLDTTSAYYSEASSEGTTYVAIVKKVKDLTGDASVAIAGGKRRYIYDFHVNVEYEIADEGGEVVATGMLRLPEVHSASTSDEELEVEILAWKTGPTPSENGRQDTTTKDCIDCRKMLVSDVTKSVLRFVEKFNATF